MKERYRNEGRLHGERVVSKNPDVVVTYTQDEASLEGGRECCCVMAVVEVGFGGERGRRGGFACRDIINFAIEIGGLAGRT